MGYVMCVHPVAWPEPDPQIAAAIAAKYPGKRPRPLAVQVRDRLGQWLRDEDFAAAFGDRGRPGWSPSRLALVTVLQRVEDLADRQAAEAVRTRIDWQYLLGLPLDDPGFDHTVLPEFRGKVAEAGLEQVALDALLGKPAAWSRRAASSAPIPPAWLRRWWRWAGWSWPGKACGPRWRRWQRRTLPGWSSGSAWLISPAGTAPR
jgi:hypothetical protein